MTGDYGRLWLATMKKFIDFRVPCERLSTFRVVSRRKRAHKKPGDMASLGLFLFRVWLAFLLAAVGEMLPTVTHEPFNGSPRRFGGLGRVLIPLGQNAAYRAVKRLKTKNTLGSWSRA